MQLRCIQQQFFTVLQSILCVLFQNGHYHYKLLSLTTNEDVTPTVQGPSTINQFVLIISISATSNMDKVGILCVRPQMAAGYYHRQCRKSSFIRVNQQQIISVLRVPVEPKFRLSQNAIYFCRFTARTDQVLSYSLN